MVYEYGPLGRWLDRAGWHMADRLKSYAPFSIQMWINVVTTNDLDILKLVNTMTSPIDYQTLC